MLKRKIYNVLSEWKKNPSRKPLILKGCRQCGKTYSVLDFVQKNYEAVVYLNFFQHPEYVSFFDGSLAVDDILLRITAALNVHFEPKKTCLVFDEIQDCPNARTSLKFFKLDGRYDVLCTGSLLGVVGYGDNVRSIPVGYEHVVDMYPLDFEEFLWANGISEDVLDYVVKCFKSETPVDMAIHNRMRELMLQYTVVGGMPEVVDAFVKNKMMDVVLSLQKDIVKSYEEDIVKYAPKETKSLIRSSFLSIPKQLGKENKKFQYSIVQKKGSAATFQGVLQWIEDAGIIRRCHNTTITELPLDGNAIDEVFKVYMADTGLFVSMLEQGTQFDILQGNLLGYKGAIFENLIADIFGKMGRKLYYFRKDSGLELDFLIRYKGQCTPVEVKATDGNAKSLKTVMNHPEKYHLEQAIKLGDYNVGRNGNVLTLPLYMAFLLREV